jgi:PPOX class probable F420-dependent enzyme
VCFAHVDGDFWTVVDEKPKSERRLKRLRNIDANPRASLIFDRYNEDWRRLAYLLVSGAAEIVEGAPPEVIAVLRQRYEQYREMTLEGRPAIRITPERVVSWGSLEPETGKA